MWTQESDEVEIGRALAQDPEAVVRRTLAVNLASVTSSCISEDVRRDRWRETLRILESDVRASVRRRARLGLAYLERM